MHCKPRSTPPQSDPSHPSHCQIMCYAPSGGTIGLTQYLGVANNRRQLQSHPGSQGYTGCTSCVLTCAQELPMCHTKHFEYMKLHIGDNPSDVIHTANKITRSFQNEQFDEVLDSRVNGAQFKAVCEWLDERVIMQGKHVVVHCAAGGSRSAAFVILYLMHAGKIGTKQAFDYCQSRRSNVCPNWGDIHPSRRVGGVMDSDVCLCVRILKATTMVGRNRS